MRISFGRLGGMALAVAIAVVGGFPSFASSPKHARPAGTPAPSPVPAVISVTVVPLTRVVTILRELYPHVKIDADRSSNAVIVLAPPDQVQAMRSVVQGIDVKNPTAPTLEIIALRVLHPATIIQRLRSLYPQAQFAKSSPTSIFVKAVPLDMTQIKSLIATLDAPIAAAPPQSNPADAVRMLQISPKAAARAVARQFPHIRASVSGANVILVGSTDDIAKAKTLLSEIDLPGFGSRYTEIYRIKNIDASSVGDLVARSYPNVKVTVDKELNAITVAATASEHQHIGNAIAQLDGAAAGAGAGATAGGGAAYGDGNIEVVELKSALPSQSQGQSSTTAADIAAAVKDALQPLASDLHVTVPNNSTEIVLSGSPQSIRLARSLIERLDRTPPLVVLDTEILEIDENVARNLGLNLGSASIQSTFQEISPQNDGNGGLGRLIGLQPVARTPIQFTAVLNLLISKGNARVLADPRITTISGRTATIRAGDTITIITSSGGGVTPVTQQIQQFNTGVILDITPIVNADGGITVALHPIVNSISPIQQGNAPTISTRDTQTVVHLRDNETLAIGGLIQEAQSKTASKIPLAGDIPFVGRLFRSENITYNRNELIMVVTPHIVLPGGPAPPPDSMLPSIPQPRALPTLPPYTQLPAPIPHPILERQTPAPPISMAPATSGTSGVALNFPSSSPVPTPAPTPSAFANANQFEYGAAPQNTYAADSDAPQIFYVRFGPTVLRQNTPVTVSAITSTNVKRVTVGVPGNTVALSQVGRSQWQATYNFSTTGLSLQPNALLTLTAYRNDGASSAIQIPIALMTP